MINVSCAQHPRNGAWVAFLAYDRSPRSDSSRAWSWAVYRPDDRRWFTGHSRPDQPNQALGDTRATLVRQVLRYCDSTEVECRFVDLYVESDQALFLDLARDWPSLDVAVRFIGRQENPARLLKGTSKSRRLIWS